MGHGWGNTDYLDREERRAPPKPEPKPALVFLTHDDTSRWFCHPLSNTAPLLRVNVRIAHRLKDEQLIEHIRQTDTIAIALSQKGTFPGSFEHRYELLCAILAHAYEKKIILICSDDRIAVQEHFEFLRKATALVITPRDHESAEALNGHFPATTTILSRAGQNEEEHLHFFAGNIRTIVER